MVVTPLVVTPLLVVCMVVTESLVGFLVVGPLLVFIKVGVINKVVGCLVVSTVDKVDEVVVD